MRYVMFLLLMFVVMTISCKVQLWQDDVAPALHVSKASPSYIVLAIMNGGMELILYSET